MSSAQRRAAAGLALLFLGLAGCKDGAKPSAPSGDQAELLKQDASKQKEMHDRTRKNQ